MQPNSHPQPPQRPSKFLVAAIICAAMLAMFVVGIFYHFK